MPGVWVEGSLWKEGGLWKNGGSSVLSVWELLSGVSLTPKSFDKSPGIQSTKISLCRLPPFPVVTKVEHIYGKYVGSRRVVRVLLLLLLFYK